nr:restriction endonuclease subunit S [uncultured Rhodoferax sp.]
MNEEKKLVPKLRFPEFRKAEGWSEEKLDDLVHFQDGFAFKSTAFVKASEDATQVIRITDINNKNTNEDNVYIPTAFLEHNNLGKYGVEDGDLLLSLTGAAGFNFFFWDGGPATINQRTAKVTSKRKEGHALLRLLEPLIHEKLNQRGEGQNNNLSKEFLNTIVLLVPEPAEQQKIAECLSSLDELIAAQARKVDALKTHKKGLMQQLFPREGETQPRLRFPEFRDAEAWKEYSLKDVLSIFQGFAFSSNDSVENGVRWLKIADVGIQKMSYSTPSHLPFQFKKQFEKFSVSEGDYVIALTRPILSGQLKMAQVDQTFAGALLNQRVGKLVTTHHMSFVYFLLQCQQTIGDIEKSISGAEPPNLSAQQIENIKTFIPSELEQIRIAECLTSVDDLITSADRELETLKTHKKGLMQQLFPPAEAVEA